MKKKKTILIVGIFLLLIIGVTFAYFETSDIFTNLFGAGDYSSQAIETFTYPTGWSPGTTTP